jgi:hypothetical protein
MSSRFATGCLYDNLLTSVICFGTAWERPRGVPEVKRRLGLGQGPSLGLLERRMQISQFLAGGVLFYEALALLFARGMHVYRRRDME